jgi:uncharacterized protein (DUF2126 family)/transglutaminase-like putative cysteine protease
MSIHVHLHHRTSYQYERPISLGPQVVRLKPAPHCRTPILSYSQKIVPADNFCNWQQDPQGNYVARYVFPEKTDRFEIEVSLVADMATINPFDFFVEDAAKEFPFVYDEDLAADLAPFRRSAPMGPLLKAWVNSVDRKPKNSIDLLVALNQRLQSEISYSIRMEPGVQAPEETLQLRRGSCRDSAWLLVQILRNLGFASRFVSGYLIQLAADIKSLDGPSGPEQDFTDLHAWTEVYMPGAGWIGLDPTSGLLCGEGHLPLACTPEPASAAPISGALEPCESTFGFEMKLTRFREDPRTTKPYTDLQWAKINEVAHNVDDQLRSQDMRLTVGGEPTFVSIDDMEGDEWNGAAVGPNKRRLSGELIKRLRRRFAPGGMLHYGEGKWYPGESLPRWAMACYWRVDGVPLWNDESLIADENRDYGYKYRDAKKFAITLARTLGVNPNWLVPAYEDPLYYIWRERNLPVNVSPTDPKLKNAEERARMARIFSSGLNLPTGLVLPLKRQWQQIQHQQQQAKSPDRYVWTSGPWPVRPEQLYLLPGDSPVGLRLPIDSLPYEKPNPLGDFFPADPFEPRPPLPTETMMQHRLANRKPVSQPPLAQQSSIVSANIDYSKMQISSGAMYGTDAYESRSSVRVVDLDEALRDTDDDDIEELEYPEDAHLHPIVRTALCVEPRDGRLYVFMPPAERLEDYVDLLSAVELTADKLRLPVIIEGYLPPSDHRIGNFKVTPDPGVIEVNVQPASSWDQLSDIVTGLYEEARSTRLGTEKFDLDGRHTGTSGGNHVVLGGATPADSPFLRRPDLLRSLIAYWVNHPSLSYIFGSRFIGPTSQAPRVDEGRRDSVYELQIALDALPSSNVSFPPWMVDRVLRNLLIDITGNTHRAEICIDKLFSPDSSSGRLGLVELRAFEMPPHPQTSLTMHLLVRSLLAMFWRKPYEAQLIDWKEQLYDKCMLPHFLREDLHEVVSDLQREGIQIETAWFEPHYEFRMPIIGLVQYQGVQIELRSAIEPWYVLGEEPGGGGTVRYVDSSVERLQISVSNFDPRRHQILVNRYVAPLHTTTTPDHYVCGVRYRAWQPPACLHPTIPVHTPLVFDLVEIRSGQSLGGCTYYVSHPAGRNYETFPVNALEAEARRAARFNTFGTPASSIVGRIPRRNPAYAMTLDLRRESV